MFKIKVISDLHINEKNKANDFRFDEIKFANYIKLICDESDLVVINGDLFECWETDGWESQVAKFLNIVRDWPVLYKELVNQMLADKLVYINGNHDAVCRIRELVPLVQKSHFLEVHMAKKTLRLYFEHGHAADKYNSRFAIVGRIITWFFGWLERRGLYDIDEDASRMYNYVREIGSDNEYQKYAHKLADDNDYDVVCIGHTHFYKLDKTHDHWYVNSGNCCTKENTLDEITILINDYDFMINYAPVVL